MGDTLSWGEKLDSFCKWVADASIDELKAWVKTNKSREWSYRDEFPIVNSEIRKRKASPTFQDLELKTINAKKREAGKLRLQARALGERASQILVEMTNLCSHPPEKVIEWYYIDSDVACCSVTQCTQCGLREEGSPTYILPRAKGRNYQEAYYTPADAKSSHTRTVTSSEREEVLQKKKKAKK